MLPTQPCAASPTHYTPHSHISIHRPQYTNISAVYTFVYVYGMVLSLDSAMGPAGGDGERSGA